ncbi:MAG TPA: hypothetical protein VM053_04135 [Gemmatimonadaceae bacterium]|nr:hypothetical protein [Gemmatimonadaceae bacterium]
MIARTSRLKYLSLCLAFTAGCTHKQPAARPPAPDIAFDAAIADASKRVEKGDYTGADRVLSDFAVAHKGTPEASEIAFWRALYMVDPSNKNASVAEGLRAMNIYLANPASKKYRAQGEVIRRVGLLTQSLRVQQAATKVVGRDTVYVTREDEITALKDQLAKANAELERIKKRLANPSR